MGDRDVAYDAFISYSRHDKVFAALLEKALEDYKPPRDLGIPQRYLRIFRDEHDFTGPGYHASLRKHLCDSAKLIVVCSPAARQSQYVDDEIRQFVKAKGVDQLVPVLISGIPNNEAGPGQEAELAFPNALCEALGMPLPADYRGFNPRKDRIGRFEDPWFKTLADLYGRSRDQIEQREKRRKIRRRNLTLALGGFVIFLFLGPTWLWWMAYSLDQALLKVQSLFGTIYVEPVMKSVPAGVFLQGDTHGLGNSHELPVHQVTIKQFAIGQFEVTFDEYDRFAIETNRPLPKQELGRGAYPVINVSWEDAREYAAWLRSKTGKRYRLPTESEWEYAARSKGGNEVWAGTSDEGQLVEYAVYHPHADMHTAPVGINEGRKPNALGLYDMSGNVWEWVEDCWHADYSEEAPSDGKAWLEANGGNCQSRVIRGGTFNTKAVDVRSSKRVGAHMFLLDPDQGQVTHKFNDLGFRLAQDIEP